MTDDSDTGNRIIINVDANDIADVITFAVTRPKSVNIEYMLVMPTAQASATRVFRK